MDKITILENELIEELQKQEEDFSYEIRKRKVYCEENSIIQHREYVKRVLSYISDAPIKHMISAPFIWSCVVPALLMDITVSVYQWVCFPIYGIPKVKPIDPKSKLSGAILRICSKNKVCREDEMLRPGVDINNPDYFCRIGVY